MNETEIEKPIGTELYLRTRDELDQKYRREEEYAIKRRIAKREVAKYISDFTPEGRVKFKTASEHLEGLEDADRLRRYTELTGHSPDPDWWRAYVDAERLHHERMKALETDR